MSYAQKRGKYFIIIYKIFIKYICNIHHLYIIMMDPYHAAIKTATEDI